jgi:hypothetical protein
VADGKIILLQPKVRHVPRKYTLDMESHVGFPHGRSNMFRTPFHNTMLLPPLSRYSRDLGTRG